MGGVEDAWGGLGVGAFDPTTALIMHYHGAGNLSPFSR
jgi:hypothetical protein